MKKITLLLFVITFSTLSYGSNWGFWDVTRSYVTIGGTEYTLWNSGVGTFQGASFNVSAGGSLSLTSIYAKTWKSSGGDVTGIDYYYAIYSGTRPSSPTFTPIGCGWISGSSSDQIWGNQTLSINLASGLAVGTYTVEIYGRLSGTGDPSSYQYDNNNGNISNYSATIVVSPVTNTSNPESSLKLTGNNGKVTAHFDGSAKIELYSAAGQLIKATNATNEFSENVNSGMYLIRINGKTHKILVN